MTTIIGKLSDFFTHLFGIVLMNVAILELKASTLIVESILKLIEMFVMLINCTWVDH